MGLSNERGGKCRDEIYFFDGESGILGKSRSFQIFLECLRVTIHAWDFISTHEFVYSRLMVCSIRFSLTVYKVDHMVLLA